MCSKGNETIEMKCSNKKKGQLKRIEGSIIYDILCL